MPVHVDSMVLMDIELRPNIFNIYLNAKGIIYLLRL